ncbi:hypothetical protein IAT38_000902 [Cryptococcus sp. DSM 104549]
MISPFTANILTNRADRVGARAPAATRTAPTTPRSISQVLDEDEEVEPEDDEGPASQCPGHAPGIWTAVRRARSAQHMAETLLWGKEPADARERERRDRAREKLWDEIRAARVARKAKRAEELASCETSPATVVSDLPSGQSSILLERTEVMEGGMGVKEEVVKVDSEVPKVESRETTVEVKVHLSRFMDDHVPAVLVVPRRVSYCSLRQLVRESLWDQACILKVEDDIGGFRKLRTDRDVARWLAKGECVLYAC